MFATHCATVRNRLQPSATVRNRPQPSATVHVRSLWPCLWRVLRKWSLLEVSNVAQPRFAWQAWHFVTFQHVSESVQSRFLWQAQCFFIVSEDALHFSWRAQHFGDLHRHEGGGSLVPPDLGRLYLQIWVACTSTIGMHDFIIFYLYVPQDDMGIDRG